MPDDKAPDLSGGAPTAPFVHERRISWWDTDAARIVYTARVPQFGMEALDGWFINRLSTDWYGLNFSLGFGSPFTHLEIDFFAPMAPPDILDTTVLLVRTGRASLHFRLDSRRRHDAKLCWRGRYSCTFIDTATFKSIPIPDVFRAAVDRELTIGTHALAGEETQS